MKKLFYCLLTALITCSVYADEECCEQDKDYLFEITTGYRQDQLKTHVIPASPDATVITENNWKDISLFQVRGTFKAETCFNTYSRAYFNYGRMVDFEHSLISPTLVLLTSNTHHEKGRVYDAEYAFGYSFYACDTLRFTPLTGYSYHRIELDSHNRVPRTIPVDSAEASKYDYFKTVEKQRTTWRAPFVGLETEFFVGDDVRICLNGQYLWAHFNNHGKAFEKYNQTYSYKQRSNGHGMIFNGEFGYAFLQSWEALLCGGYQYWDAKGGSDRTTYSLDPDVTIKSHLKTASWRSYEISLGLSYTF